MCNLKDKRASDLQWESINYSVVTHVTLPVYMFLFAVKIWMETIFPVKEGSL